MRYHPLFVSQSLRLTPVDPEKDTQIIADWTYDLEVARKLRGDQPARPMAAFELKKLTEQWAKEVDENKHFLFALRRVDSDEVVGMVRLSSITWVHGAAYLDLIIGDPAAWQQCSREALDLALRYAFDELRLFRVTVVVPEHDTLAYDLFQQANFTLEARQRKAIYWRKNTWDKLFLGILRPEWKLSQPAEAVL